MERYRLFKLTEKSALGILRSVNEKASSTTFAHSTLTRSNQVGLKEILVTTKVCIHRLVLTSRMSK